MSERATQFADEVLRRLPPPLDGPETREQKIRRAWDESSRHFDFRKMPVWRAYPSLRWEDVGPVVSDKVCDVEVEVFEFRLDRGFRDGRPVERVTCGDVVLSEWRA